MSNLDEMLIRSNNESVTRDPEEKKESINNAIQNMISLLYTENVENGKEPHPIDTMPMK